MTEQEIRILLQKYTHGQASLEEQALLEMWYHQQLSKQPFSDDNLDSEKLKAEIWKATKQKSFGTSLTGSRNLSSRLRLPLVAAIALIISVGSYYYIAVNDKVHHYTVDDLANKDIDISPGTDRATLILADGRVIDLSDEKEGIIISNDVLTYSDGTEIDGHASSLSSDPLKNSSSVTYNTITTPKGGQYSIVLPDGSRVWLNAASTLRYPSRFDDLERRVELTGEAYFEIKQQQLADRKTSKPFIVKSQTQDIEVLGTHFNVNTYADEPIAVTTLIEGSVNVVSANGNEATKLNPGQQSIVKPGRKTRVLAADVEEAIGWKKGEFIFYNESIEKVMNDIARWYDIEVIYSDPVQKKKMWGSVSRFENISEVLKMIELTGTVHFDLRIKGDERRVYVMN